MADDYEDHGSIDDVYSASELYEMDRDAEFAQDAADDAANTAAVQAEDAELDDPDEACGEGMCHCHCDGSHVCGCGCPRCPWCQQLPEYCDCED